MKINNQKYKIVEARVDSEILEHGKLLGLTVPYRNRIYISKGLLISRKHQIIAHEVIHALMAEAGLTTSLENIKEDSDIEETVAAGLENVFYNFLRENTNFYDKL